MKRPVSWRTRLAASATLLTLALSGCTPTAPAPTGDELVAEARQHYMEYRTITNDVQALIFDGAWESDIGSYGMQPVGAGCPDGAYRFDLTRTTRIEPGDQDELRTAVVDYLGDAGFELEGQELGSGESLSHDVIVRKQGPFSTLMVTFIGNGSVLVTAATTCWPGDQAELSGLIFGGVTLSEGYLPRQESPTDPLFFGVTPGEPEFTSEPAG